MTLLLLQLMGMKYKCLHRWLSSDLTHQISGCFCQSWSTVCYQTGPIVLLRLTLLLFIGSLMLCCLFPLWLLLGSPSQAISQPSTRDTSLGLTDTSRNILVLGLQIDPKSKFPCILRKIKRLRNFNQEILDASFDSQKLFLNSSPWITIIIKIEGILNREMLWQPLAEADVTRVCTVACCPSSLLSLSASYINPQQKF